MVFVCDKEDSMEDMISTVGIYLGRMEKCKHLFKTHNSVSHKVL